MTVRRSDATRAAILAAARDRFAADGYDRATIRAIAKDARIDPSMVMRYFGSKDGLFAAAVALDLRLPDLTRVSRDEVGRTLVGHFLGLWEENEELTAVLRVGATNEAGAERMQGIFRDQLLPVARQVCPDPSRFPRGPHCAPPSCSAWPSPATCCGCPRPARSPPRNWWPGWARRCSAT